MNNISIVEEVPFARETIAVSNTVESLDSNLVAEANRALIQFQGVTRVTLTDGEEPTVSVGFQYPSQTFMTLVGRLAMNSFKFIRNGTSDSTVEVAYFKSTS